jgi:hypothetical protein
MPKDVPSRTAESKRSMQRGESKHGKHPAETVSSIESEHVGSPGRTGQSFRMPADSEVCDHSKVRGLD